MGFLLVLAWYITLNSWFGNGEKYQKYIEEAKRLEEKGLYLDAISIYEKAKELDMNAIEVDEYIADDYLAMGNYKEYKKQLNNIIDSYGPVETDVAKLYQFYREYSSENSLINWISDLYNRYPESAIAKEYYNTIKGVYSEKYISLDYIGAFSGKYAPYELDGKVGLLEEDGKTVIEAVYDEIQYNGQDDDKITVKDGNHYYLINSSGYRTNVTEESYEYLGVLSQKRIVARKNGKYGYLDGSMKEKLEFIYDDATSFYEGIAAVKKGDKWALIDRKGELITEYIYDDVAVNSMNICSVNSVIGVQMDGVWRLINEKGEQIGINAFQNMKAFESQEPCAVCKDGKWGFMDVEGNLVIECTYQDAKSFSNGFAPISKENLWGFVDLENFEIITCVFNDVGQMTKNGVAPVSHGGTWTLIELKVLN